MIDWPGAYSWQAGAEETIKLTFQKKKPGSVLRGIHESKMSDHYFNCETLAHS